MTALPERVLDVACKLGKPGVILPTGLTKFVLRGQVQLGLPTLEHPNAVDYGTLYGYVKGEKAS